MINLEKGGRGSPGKQHLCKDNFEITILLKYYA